jgi:hypothetical protein
VLVPYKEQQKHGLKTLGRLAQLWIAIMYTKQPCYISLLVLMFLLTLIHRV